MGRSARHGFEGPSCDVFDHVFLLAGSIFVLDQPFQDIFFFHQVS